MEWKAEFERKRVKVDISYWLHSPAPVPVPVLPVMDCHLFLHPSFFPDTALSPLYCVFVFIYVCLRMCRLDIF